MLRLILLIGFSTIIQKSISQQRLLDSLLPELSRHKQMDSIRLNLLNEISYAYSSIDPVQGLAMADSAILLGKKINLNKKLASAYSNKGVNYWALGEDSLAAVFYKQALEIHQSNKYETGIAIAYNNLGLLAFNSADYVKALEYHFKSLQSFEHLKDSSRLPDAYANIGVDYQYLSEYPRALDYYLKGLRIAEAKNNTHSRAIISANIGLVYKNFLSYPESLNYQEKALALYNKDGNKQGIASTLGNIGVLYSLMQKYEMALTFFQRALKINREIGSTRRIASDITNIGLVFKRLKDYSSAIKNLDESLELYREINDQDNCSIVLSELGNIYTVASPENLKESGIDPAGRLTTALHFQKEALKIAMEIHSVERQSEVWKLLAETYEKTGESNKALAAYKNYSLLHDSIISNEKKEYVMKKAMQFDFEKKEDSVSLVHARQLAIETAETSRQKIIRSFIVWGAVFLFLSTMAIFFFYRRKKDAEQQQKEAELKAEVSDTEMKALRAQMNPHFIFNSLNSISDYISRNEHQKANDYLVKFSKLIRKTLEHSEKKLISLADDLQMLDLYLQLERKRLNGKFDFNIHVDEKIDLNNTLIPPLILQPFVENSIWHGIANKEGQGHIEISILQKGNMLHCLIDDDGIGREVSSRMAEANNNQSMGMRITKTRIDMMNKLKKSNGTVELQDRKSGLRVQVNLPFELSF